MSSSMSTSGGVGGAHEAPAIAPDSTRSADSKAQGQVRRGSMSTSGGVGGAHEAPAIAPDSTRRADSKAHGQVRRGGGPKVWVAGPKANDARRRAAPTH
jgi:hypothetical protein